MLFGDLKNGGLLNITVADGSLALTAKPKAPKVVVNETSTVDTNQADNQEV
jgi:hypothetical protein